MNNRPHLLKFGQVSRIRVFYAVLLLVVALFAIRLFYLQVIKYEYYKSSALSSQLKEYEIPAKRGVIEAHNGSQVVPIVLNETKFTLYADPKYIKEPEVAAGEIEKIIGGNKGDYEKLMKTPDTRYVILAKKLDKDQSKKIEELNIKGVGTRESDYRTYPQGNLSSQLLGFVNDDNEGKYGIEQFLNTELSGKSGLLKAITDAQGVPLASQKDNILVEPSEGKRVLLTIDIGLQQRLEEVLKNGVEHAQSKSGGAMIMNAKTGEIVAMANYPTYNPADYAKEEDPSVFNNSLVSAPLEVGSIMKPLTVAAAINEGVVNRNTSYFDPGYFIVDEAKITNIEEVGGAATKTVQDIIQQSLNTGATWLLMQMGGGQINEKARNTWHGYMADRYNFGKQTGIEQGYESGGTIPDPNDGFGLNIQYANTAFGQGMTATPLQMAAAFSAVINGGTYYRPTLVDKIIDSNGNVDDKQPQVIRQNVVSASTSNEVRGILEYAFSKNYVVYGVNNLRPEYSIGTKTGTAQIPAPNGGYYENRFNGTFLSYVGGNEPEYVVAVRVDDPKIGGYAGSKAAAPIGTQLLNILIDSYGVAPRK